MRGLTTKPGATNAYQCEYLSRRRGENGYPVYTYRCQICGQIFERTTAPGVAKHLGCTTINRQSTQKKFDDVRRCSLAEIDRYIAELRKSGVVRRELEAERAAGVTDRPGEARSWRG